jgi:hypothetical protein
MRLVPHDQEDRLLRSAIQISTILAALALAGAAQAARPVTAKVSKRGYTLVALAPTGKATSARARGKVRLAAPSATFTLHLVGPTGTYAGPVVVGKRGQQVVLGVRAGAALGTIVVRDGYATLARPLKKSKLDGSRRASARQGIPVGARVYGRVLSPAKGPAGAGLDQDRDGIPGTFDVDDDGDLVLDNFERQAPPQRFSALAALLGPGPGEPNGGFLFSNFKLNLPESLNANAGGVTAEQVSQRVAQSATLAIAVPPGDSVELDCGGLSYCSKGGTGHVLGGPAFPAEFDTDGDGFGTLTKGPTNDFQLFPGAPADKIGSGDTFIYRITTGGVETQKPMSLNYVFSTTPALNEWSTAAGSGTVSYPAGPMTSGGSANPIAVGSDGRVTMTFWRPQRAAIDGSGEGDGWVDIGRLRYTADVPNGPGGPSPGPGNCRPSAYSTTDPNLSLQGDALVDSTLDRAANPSNTLTFTVDLNDCLAKNNIAWSSGQSLKVDIQARSEYGDNAAQGIFFVRS